MLMLVVGCSDDDSPELADPESAYQPPTAQRERPVAGYAAQPVSLADPSTGTPFEAPATIWPAPAVAELALGDPAGRPFADDGAALVGGLPVRVDGDLDGAFGAAPPARVVVESLGHAATALPGVDGVLIRVARSDGASAASQARITLGYGAFRWAHGGDWASRLALWRVPACALSSPGAPGCQATRLASSNDLGAGRVTATVDIAQVATTFTGEASGDAGGTLVLLAADASGSGGDYKATSLAPAATWSAGGNSGEFTWSYSLRVPESLGGPTPKVALGYSSSSVDGRMASTNNQASWIGEGFRWHPGSIERHYSACAEDMGAGANNTVKTGDQCWETDNAALSLDGHAGELLKDASNPNLWHLRNDDPTRVERKTGGPNGDDNGEWWMVTTSDGTQYWFGGRAGSNATLTVPVFGNHGGEPCHQDAFASSSCAQGYRWMLDYVVDPLGNTMSFTYDKETNKYGRNNNPADARVYDRDGYLKKIEYGTRTDAPGSAPMQVVFDVADRCLSGCTAKDAQHWPDVPWDRECTAATCAITQTSPSFWTTKRLTSVKTQVWGGAGYRDVESWTLSHSFPSSDQPALWLDRIAHNGLVGGTSSVPDITFVGVVMPNRVDTDNDQFPAMNRYRMKTINSETGGKLDVTYAMPDCVRGTRVPDQNALHDNALRCYPVKWTPEGRTSPINDFFHKYVVSDVVEADLSGSSSRVVTHYDYVGAPAWHYTDDDGFVRKDARTWSVWRGYAAVRTIKGDPGEQTLEERRYFRGMHGDTLPSGTRTVMLPAIAIGNVPAAADEDAFAGQLRETITFNGPGGGEVTATVNELWQSPPTASRTINGTTVHARHVNTAVVHIRTALDGGRGHRTMASVNSFDSFGMTTQIDDRGDEAVTGDERCTLTDYVRNTAAWIVEKPARQRSFAVSCSRALAGGLTSDDVIDDVKSFYDGQAWNVAPTRGRVTRIDGLSSYAGGSPQFRTETRHSYDSYGRTLEATDARGNKTVTAYQPAIGGPVTATTETTQLGWVTTTTFEPAWHLPLSSVDSNGRKTELAYDPWGRVISVWLPGRDRASKPPSTSYEYVVRNNAPTVVVTRQLNASGGYTTSYNFVDNLLRQRQTQVLDAAGGAGAVVTDTYYDSAGRAVKVHEPYLAVNTSLAPVAPSTNLFVPTQNIPRLKVKQFDGADRIIATIDKVDGPPASPGGSELWRTTTRYGGDRIDTTPPAGGITTSAVQDARGNTIELRRYQPGRAAGSPTGFDKTTYQFNQKNKLARVTDAAGNVWQYSYDVSGNQIQEVSPDKGTIVTTYTADNEVETVTDARGIAIAYTYDVLGRKATMRDGSVTGAKRAEWIYDQLPNGTQVANRLITTIRYEGTARYLKEVLGFTADYRPTTVRYTIPDSATASSVAGAFSYVYTYREDGSLATLRLPALGDPALGVETLTYGYNSLGNPTTLGTSLGGTLVAAPDMNTPGTEYTSLGELAVIHLRHNAGARADIGRLYDTTTRRLTQIWTTRATGPTTVADLRYSYDAIGNVTQISDLAAGDHQCFTTDHLRQLTQAWTPASGDCNAAPALAALGGPARYWHNFSYDALGNRTRLQAFGTASGTRDTSYTVPAGSHRLTTTSTVDANGTTTREYSYDASGNVRTRPTPAAGLQTLSWDAEGHLATSQDATGTTAYLYDPDGNRFVRSDPTGTTLYLPDQELRVVAADGAKKTTRYYRHAGQLIATRSAAHGVVWLSGDHHDTARVSISAVGQAASIRQETPFGELRGATGTWPSSMDKGFVGGTTDNTGLTHLGAREYDPALGRFLSVDPAIDPEDPLQMQGYAYANNAPITASDANGLWPNWGAVGKWMVDNAGHISAAAGVAAAVCMFIPGAQVLVPALTIVSVGFGIVDATDKCLKGDGAGCAVGIASTAVSVVPGGAVVGKIISGARQVPKLQTTINAVQKAAAKARLNNKETAAALRPFRQRMRDVIEKRIDADLHWFNFWHPHRLSNNTSWNWLHANRWDLAFLYEQTTSSVSEIVAPPVQSLGQRRTITVPPMPPWQSLKGTIHSPTHHHRHGTGAPDF